MPLLHLWLQLLFSWLKRVQQTSKVHVLYNHDGALTVPALSTEKPLETDQSRAQNAVPLSRTFGSSALQKQVVALTGLTEYTVYTCTWLYILSNQKVNQLYHIFWLFMCRGRFPIVLIGLDSTGIHYTLYTVHVHVHVCLWPAGTRTPTHPFLTLALFLTVRCLPQATGCFTSSDEWRK